MLTLTELANKLVGEYDEVTIMEMLEINSQDLIDRFMDKLEEKYDQLIEEHLEEGEEGMGDD